MKMICSVYKSKKKDDELYLYVDKREGLARVPAALLEMTGKLDLAMTLLLTPDKKLARADVTKVLKDIEEKGFYLQMPPAREGYVVDYHSRENK